MKDHAWWHFFLDQERKLARTYPDWIDLTEPGDAADRFADLVLSTQKAVEKAIRRFAKTGQWLPMSQRVGAMVRVRLSLAADHWEVLEFARRNLGFQSPAKEHPRHRMIVLLLIDLWEVVGFPELHGSLEHLRRAGEGGRKSEFHNN